MLLAILEAASGDDDAPLRNILLDPALLGADRSSGVGKLYPDTKDYAALNIAKMVNSFCQEEWGCTVREAILDKGKPARRKFREEEDPEEGNPPSALSRETPTDPVRVHRQVPADNRPYDWRKIARAMGDRGWRRYFSEEELDLML